MRLRPSAPRRTLWERGRYIEYLLAFSFFKRVQDHYGKPLISSGCFSIYRTEELRALGGWSTRTMAEDMDLTWTMYQAGQKVRFVPEAVSYPIEPHNFALHEQAAAPLVARLRPERAPALALAAASSATCARRSPSPSGTRSLASLAYLRPHADPGDRRSTR